MSRFRVLILSLSVLLGLAAVLLGALLIYFDDNRLKTLVIETARNELKIELKIDSLELRLLNNLTLTGLSVSSRKDSTQPPLKIGKIYAQWSILSLLRGNLSLEKFAINAVELNLVDTVSDNNFLPEKQKAAVKPAATPKAKPAKEKKKKTPKAFTWQPPNIPITVEINDVVLTQLSINYRHDDFIFSLSDLGGSLALEAHGEQIEGRIESYFKSSEGAPNISLSIPKQNIHVQGIQDLSLKIAINSYQDIQTKLAYRNGLSIKHSEQNYRLNLRHEVEAFTDLAQQSLRIEKLSFVLGKFLNIILRAELMDGANNPVVSIKDASGALNLEQAQSLADTLAPGLSLAGLATFEIQPTSLNIKQILSQINSPEINLGARLQGLELTYEKSRIKNLNGHLALKVENGKSNFTLQQSLDEVTGPNIKAKDIHFLLANEFLIDNLLQAYADQKLAFNFKTSATLSTNTIKIASAKLDQFSLENETLIPLTFLLQDNPPQSLESSTLIDIQNIQADALKLRTMTVQTDLALSEKTLSNAEALTRTRLNRLRVSGPTPLKLAFIDCTLPARKKLHSLAIDNLHCNISNVLKGQLHLSLPEILSPKPLPLELKIRLKKADISKLTKTLGPIVPDGEYSGHISGDFKLKMRIPDSSLLKKIEQNTPTFADASTILSGLSQYLALSYESLALRGGGKFNIENLELDIPEVIGLKSVNFLTLFDIDRQGIHAKTNLRINSITSPVQTGALAMRTSINIDKHMLKLKPVLSLSGYSISPEYPKITKAKTSGEVLYSFDDTMTFKDFKLAIKPFNIAGDFSGSISNALQVGLSKDPENTIKNALLSSLNGQISITNPSETPLILGKITTKGALSFKGNLDLALGTFNFKGALSSQDFDLLAKEFSINGMSGSLPYNFVLNLHPHSLAIPVFKHMDLIDSPIGIQTTAKALERTNTKTSYFARQNSYTNRSGLHIDSIRYENYRVNNFVLDASLKNTLIDARHFAMNVLGGDIMGNASFQINPDRSIAGVLSTQVSNLDASYFPALEMQPGKESELSANMYADFLLGASVRDFNMDMNVTKIGSKTLNRFVLLLDPEKKDRQLQTNRRNLRFIRIDQVNTWVRRENLNMDLYYTALLRIPWTRIGFRPINTEMLRRYSLSGFMDASLQGEQIAPLRKALGW